MEANHSMSIHNQEEKSRIDQGKSHGVQQAKQEAHRPNPSSSPPSSSSSPSHEFSFTISLHPSSTAKTKSAAPPPPFDLSPADEIFFHGHLLPLHLLSHLPLSPRSSTNSLDSFTLPIKELSENNNDDDSNNNNESDDQYISIDNTDHCHSISQDTTLLQGKQARKSKSFSLFGLPRWRTTREKEYEYQDQRQKRNKSKFDVSHVIKRYMRLMKPFISLRNYRRENNHHRNNDIINNDDDDNPRKLAFSYSGNFNVRSCEKELRGKRGELFSAPASMRTSPTNSGLLVASGSATPTSANDSTMEELQAAIQAAIAHCKKSIAAEDKNQAAATEAT